MQLLLVEDDIESKMALESMLRKRGIDVTAVPDAEQAVCVLDVTRFDVVVADIKLPGMDGIGLLRHVRREQSDLPVILLTGYGTLPSAIEALKLGAQEYIMKPMDSIDDIIRPITKAVRHSRLVAENRALAANLKASETRFKELYANMPSGAIVFDVRDEGDAFVVKDINRAASTLEEVPSGKVIGRDVTDAFPYAEGIGLAHRQEQTAAIEAFLVPPNPLLCK
jgi:DNA-binding NtrC family response regulator